MKVERITEIIPYEETGYPEKFSEAAREFFVRSTDRKQYRLNNIFEFDRAEEVYRKCGEISEYSRSRLALKLGEEKVKELTG